MSNFIENDLEQAAMEWFQDLGYQTQYGPDNPQMLYGRHRTPDQPCIRRKRDCQ